MRLARCNLWDTCLACERFGVIWYLVVFEEDCLLVRAPFSCRYNRLSGVRCSES